MSERVQVRAYDHGGGGSGVVVEDVQIDGEYGPLRIWLPGSAGYPAEVSFPDDFWRCDRSDLVAMRDALDLAIQTMDKGHEPCFYCRRGMHDSCISGEVPCRCCA